MVVFVSGARASFDADMSPAIASYPFGARLKNWRTCHHLARFIDKIHLHLAGNLPEDYQMPLFHERGVVGFFMRHFGLTREELLKAVQEANHDDAKVPAWFESRIGNDEQLKTSWNEFSANLGRPGQPMHETLAWAKKKYSFQCDDPTIDSVFKTIEWDEGRLPR